MSFCIVLFSYWQVCYLRLLVFFLLLLLLGFSSSTQFWNDNVPMGSGLDSLHL